jgi:2-polyprenyl-3-methyl-5-hydroxy-6-metoxy-1,4-benzoquinol methylase
VSLRRLARNWNEFAARDPLWSILTWDDKRGNRWNLDEFLGTGRSEINAALRWARECRPQFGAGRALDFGCGVGRLTQALAASFAEVHGVDISENMIEAARRLDPEERATYHVNGSADLALFPDEHFDFVYSSITLQHMEPWLMRGYLREFARVLAPGGLMMFQLPEALRGAPTLNPFVRRVGAFGARVSRWTRSLVSRQATMDMFGMARDEVRAVLDASGCRVLRVDESTLAGVDWVSFMYFAGD